MDKNQNDLRELIYQRHRVTYQHKCQRCGDPWPCDARAVLRALEDQPDYSGSLTRATVRLHEVHEALSGLVRELDSEIA